jgi:uncharacterized delta-60 repeat protein
MAKHYQFKRHHKDRTRRGQRGRAPYSRRLRVEGLEDRRLLAAGDLDTTFGSAGMNLTDFSSTSDFGSAVAVQGDGKTVVGGYSGNDAGLNDEVTFSLARYHTDGSLDTSFGTGGKVVTDFGGIALLHSIVVQADGKILGAGYVDRGLPTGIDFAIARYHSDGSLDAEFSGDGKQTTDFGYCDDAYSQSTYV